jgi:hypothetical protein
MLCTNKSQLIFLSCACLTGITQVLAEPTNIDAAVEAAKMKKAMGTEVKSLEPNTAVAKLQPLTIAVEQEPKLWSIKGINDQYIAEILLNNKIFQVPLNMGARFQDWEIVSFNSASITVSKRNVANDLLGVKNEKKKTPAFNKTIELFTQSPGHTLWQYQPPQDGEINTLQRKTAASLPIGMQPMQPMPPINGKN